MSIHYSIIFVFLAYSFALLLSNQKVFNNRRAFWLLAIGSIVVLISGVTLFQKIAALNFFFVSRYTSYVELASSPGGLGYKWIFNLVPYFLILGLHRSTYEKNEDHTIYIISIVYMFVSAILYFCSYLIPPPAFIHAYTLATRELLHLPNKFIKIEPIRPQVSIHIHE